MNSYAKLIAAGVILGAALLAHLFRFEIIPTAGGLAYRMDRWTGEVTLLRLNSEEAIAPPPANIFDQLEQPAQPQISNGPWKQYAPGK